VEIHRSGEAWNGMKKNEGGNQGTAATFKWSRNNGSVIFPVRQLVGETVILEHLGRDCTSTLEPNDWVEIVDDDVVRRNRPRILAQIDVVKPDELTITLKLPLPTGVTLPSYTANDYNDKHVLLRRWNHKGSSSIATANAATPASDGALLVSEGPDNWITLEDGVQICFQPAPNTPPHKYRPGDYWLIPARLATGDVEWQRDRDLKPIPRRPHGVDHHYAPLAIVVEVSEAGVKAPWRS
jgi:hypothetical protein